MDTSQFVFLSVEEGRLPHALACSSPPGIVRGCPPADRARSRRQRRGQGKDVCVAAEHVQCLQGNSAAGRFVNYSFVSHTELALATFLAGGESGLLSVVSSGVTETI